MLAIQSLSRIVVNYSVPIPMLPPDYNQTLLIVFLGIRDTEKDLDALFDLEIRMHDLVDDGNLGMVDGNEIDLGESPNFVDFTIFLYTSNAQKLLILITPLLKTSPFIKKAHAILRNGLHCDRDERAPETRVQLDTL